MLMLEPHDRPRLDSGRIVFPQSPLNRWNRRCLAFFVDALGKTLPAFFALA